MSLYGKAKLETKLEVRSSVRAQLRVRNSYKIRREVHSSATAGVRRSQDEVSDNWQCQSMVKGYE